ncbi:hypothetical protein PAXINDRAFT_81843 [Paxillus involutus ATCC 200175]|uniref:Anaphase-promoting complex subunit 4 WD40 domain-containing protein n=1 Tax=Paxillus involutus ATCC 200175 TaxID=664439 RepID=A0A0C9SUZ6_PAXIN|nr:hypothetical protein PAXINDRAFT_81843 [Paxillus involutus ATCC 200175]
MVWSTTTGERLAAPFIGHTYTVYCVQLSLDKIASCDYRDLRIWHSHIGELLIPPIQVKARSLAWTPNGQQLIAGCFDGSIKLFDASTATTTGSLIAEWKGHTNVIYSIAVSRNGKFLASGSDDNTVRLWDTATQQQIGPNGLQHDGYVTSVAISPDGCHLASGGSDEKVRIWSLQHIFAKSLDGNTPKNAVRSICLQYTKLY